MKDLQVETRFLEAVERRAPDDPRVLEALGNVYTRSGRRDDGLRIDVRLSELCPCAPGNRQSGTTWAAAML